jgi:hypothetical protein
MENEDAHLATVRGLVLDADREGLLVKPSTLTGFSGDKLVGCLQRLGKYQAASGHGCYLEVGVFQGMTLISTALALDGAPAFGVDNFSQFDASNQNRSVIATRSAANGTTNAHLLDRDYEDALLDPDLLGGLSVGLYFVDGPHDYRSQLFCLEAARRHLSEHAVIVVDDCNYQHVRQANRDFLTFHPEFRLMFEAYTPCHPSTMSPKDEEAARSGWWNGVNILVRDSAGQLPIAYPKVPRTRTLYENDHILFSERYAVLAPDALRFVDLLASLKPQAARAGLGMFRTARALKSKGAVGKFPALNTYSEDLPAFRICPESAQE